ncbi:hypothetical protein [Methanolobus sp. WCC4]|uniref:hypothetical protein n=1 Tax=Methanolobus sp. WCC4 TaxID=3125784 RepID=UPI0030FB6641
MIKKVLFVLIISILILSISGCTDEVVEDTPANTEVTGVTTNTVIDTIPADYGGQELVPMESLPESYELLGVRELSVEYVEDKYVSVSGIIGASEGLYMYMDSIDVYVDVIEMSDSTSAEEFITEYKAGFRSLSVGEGRFTDVSFNKHSAVRILEYVTVDTNDVKRYNYIWNNGKFVFVVGGATDDYTVLGELAEATGY